MPSRAGSESLREQAPKVFASRLRKSSRASRGDHREDLFVDDKDRKCCVETLGEACARTGWQVHAYCLMSNHFHLVVETPQANLSEGMKWIAEQLGVGSWKYLSNLLGQEAPHRAQAQLGL